VRPTEELEVIKAHLQSRFRSGVGTLHYLIKHSRPNIANEVRELAKYMDGVTLAACKDMLRVVRLALDTKFFLKLEPKKDEYDWNLLFYVDTD
jgi:hypothetical protein